MSFVIHFFTSFTLFTVSSGAVAVKWSSNVDTRTSPAAGVDVAVVVCEVVAVVVAVPSAA
jgi:hypothetical protein